MILLHQPPVVPAPQVHRPPVLRHSQGPSQHAVQGGFAFSSRTDGNREQLEDGLEGGQRPSGGVSSIWGSCFCGWH